MKLGKMPKPKSLNYISFIRRFIIVFILFGLIYLAYYLIILKPSLNTAQPTSQSTLREDLNQHLLALEALQKINSGDPTTPFRIETLRSATNRSIDEYKQDENQYNKNRPNQPLPDIQSIFSREATFLAQFDKNYSDLKNIILYSPSTDLGSLDTGYQKTEIQNRINSAVDALANKIKSSSTISETTKKDLSNFIPCLENINNNLPSKKSDYKKSVEKCQKKYTKAKISAINDILKPLSQPEFIDTLKQIKSALDDYKI